MRAPSSQPRCSPSFDPCSPGAALVCFAIAALCFALHRFLPSDDEDEAGCQEEGADADGSAAAEEGHGGKGAECPADAFITAAGYTKL